MNNSRLFGLVIWGVLVGFVGWSSCFRLGEPIANWLLLPAQKIKPVHVGIVRLLVTFFLIFANLLTIALLPMIFASVGWPNNNAAMGFKNLFGVAFISSLAGFFLQALIIRLCK